jgi:hypothetical protein
VAAGLDLDGIGVAFEVLIGLRSCAPPRPPRLRSSASSAAMLRLILP